MRPLIFALALLAAASALAAEPQSVTLPASAVQHALVYLRAGGTRAEGDALADQLLAAAQADVAKQEAAKAPSASAPTP